MLRPGEADPNFASYGDVAAERAECWDRAREAGVWYLGLAEHTKRAMREYEIRCPVNGCSLAEVVRLPLTVGGYRYLFLGYKLKYKTSPGFLNWVFSDDWSGPMVWWPAGCRHGQAKLERAWMLDVLAFIHGWHGPLESVEEFRAHASETVRRGLARRVFHPEPVVWRPKPKRAAGSIEPQVDKNSAAT
ncbi:hypothetical protein ACWDV4_00115 [Micromonospora sp. NPDC003197]